MVHSFNNPSFAVFRQGHTRIPVLEHRVDGYPIEEHRLDLATTEHPVESGNELTDNAVKRRERLRLQGWVSDLLPAPGNTHNVERASDTWNEIVQLFEARTPIDVITTLRTYRNMLIARAVAPVDKTTGYRSLRFTIDLVEVLFTDTELSRISDDVVDQVGPAARRLTVRDHGERASRAMVAPAQVTDFVRRVQGARKLPTETQAEFEARKRDVERLRRSAGQTVGDVLRGPEVIRRRIGF